MAYLFRAYSDQSQGINTLNLFTPGAASTHVLITTYDPPKKNDAQLGQQLKDALAWKKTPSPFIFWTPSLFFALQVARSRKRKGETNVRITALDIESARTAQHEEKKVTFTPVPVMLKQCAIRLEKKDGTEYDYRNEILTMDCVVPGAESRTADYEVLDLHGLHDLYPALNWTFERDDGRTRLHRNTETLSGFHFQEEQSLTSGRLGVAVGLARTFVARGGQMGEVDSTILAHLLALRKRSQRDPVLMSWIELNAVEVCKLDDDDDDACSASFKMIEAIDLEEVKQFLELKHLFKDRYISVRGLDLSMGAVSPREIKAELADWKRWDGQQRLEHAAKKEARPDFDPIFKRRERKLPRSGSSGPGSSESSGDASARDAAYAARRASRKWLPREEYLAQRDARRLDRGGRMNRVGLYKTSSTVSGVVSQPRGVHKKKRDGNTASKRA